MYPEEQEAVSTPVQEPEKKGIPGDKSGDMHIDEVCFSSWFEGKHVEWGD